MINDEESILQDYSRLVNELVDARREMSRLNDALRQKEEFLTNILQIAPSIIYAADLEKEKLIFINRDLPSELGFPQGDYQEKCGIPFALVDSEDRSALEQLYQNPSINEIQEVHFRLKTASGQERWYRLRQKAVEHSNSSASGIVIRSIEEIWNFPGFVEA